MSKKKKKYYTVWKGHHTGVFESWDDCKAQIKDFQGAQYKSFLTFEAAKKALKGNYKDYIGKTNRDIGFPEEYCHQFDLKLQQAAITFIVSQLASKEDMAEL